MPVNCFSLRNGSFKVNHSIFSSLGSWVEPRLSHRLSMIPAAGLHCPQNGLFRVIFCFACLSLSGDGFLQRSYEAMKPRLASDLCFSFLSTGITGGEQEAWGLDFILLERRGRGLGKWLRGPGFGSRHPCYGSQSSVMSVPGDPTLASDF